MSQPSTAAQLSTATNTYLLEGLKHPDNRTVWHQYVDRYRPMLVGYARRLGLGDDAEDIAQQTLVRFSSAYRGGKYDRDRGRLRDWLFGIARNELRNWCRRYGRREVQVVGDADQTDFFAQLADEDHLERTWEREWREAVLRQCLSEVKQEVDAKTFQAFELFASQGLPARSVAERLEITSNAVYIAKHRILKRIRELLPEMESVW